jgi:hypothetical protein
MSHAVRKSAAVPAAETGASKLAAKSHSQHTATSGASRQTAFNQTSGDIRILCGRSRRCEKLLLAVVAIMR